MLGYGRAFLIALSLFSLVFTGQRAQSTETPSLRFRDRVPYPPLVGCSPTAVSLSISGGSSPADKTDAQQAARFCRAINDLLQQERFQELDRIAEEARAGQSRFAGGGWKLYGFYGRVTSMSSNPSESEWTAKLARFNRWLTARPNSVTARTALATLYERYSFALTASGSGPEVEAVMWKTFHGRLKRAQDLLDQAQALHSHDPQIYLVLLRVARSQALERSVINQLFEQAIAASPGYYYYYLEQVDTLKADSPDGGPVRFAAASADRIGGTDGDIVYFHIAHEFGFYQPQYLAEMSWARILKGFNATQAEYGTSLMKLNWLCQIATYQDRRLEAAKLFDRIGKNWDEETWTHPYLFEAMKEIAQTVRGLDGPKASGMPLFRKYNDAVAVLFRQKYSQALNLCGVGAGNPVPLRFSLYLQIKADGSVTDSAFLNDHEMSLCLDTALQNARFPAPPANLLSKVKTSIWLRIPIRPDHLEKPDPLMPRFKQER